MAMTTTDAQERDRKLDRLKNRPTRYELILTDGETSYLVGYSVGRSRHSLLMCAQKSARQIIKATGLGDDAKLVWKSNGVHGARAEMGTPEKAWSLRFSGRTQREAISGQEHPFIGDVAL